MGMFTSAIDANGNEWQFKHGDDQCETYRLGQPPERGIYKPIPDGLYEGFNFSRSGSPSYAMLVMQNDRLMSVLPLTREIMPHPVGGCPPFELLARYTCTAYGMVYPGNEKLHEEFADYLWDNPRVE